jgi:atypical dual specificity phosphatase
MKKPHNFSFVIPQRLAGMSFPGIMQPLEQELQYLKAQHIRAIVSLTERQLDTTLLAQYDMHYLHLPIRDFAPPTLGQIERFVMFVDENLERKKGVVVHCQAGMGRTGTMLACYLVRQGHTPNESIYQIRSLRPGSIESSEQEDIIFTYAACLAQNKAERSSRPNQE